MLQAKGSQVVVVLVELVWKDFASLAKHTIIAGSLHRELGFHNKLMYDNILEH
jgi:hypothetical protein